MAINSEFAKKNENERLSFFHIGGCYSLNREAIIQTDKIKNVKHC